MPGMSDNHRTADRRRVLKAGTIAYNQRYSTLPCTVRDLSATGARLRISDVALVPTHFDLLIDLEAQARSAGGALVVTLGNHEAEFLADPTDAKSREFQAELARLSLDPAKVAAGETRYGAWLNSRPVAALVDGWFFCHGGNTDGKSASAIGDKYRDLFSSKKIAGPSVFADSYLLKSSSLLEESGWWNDGGAGPVALIDANLAALPARHVVFGHDPGDLSFPADPLGDRSRGRMVARYDGRVFAIDVGMSYAIGYSDGALLRIVRGEQETASAIYPDGRSTQLWP